MASPIAEELPLADPGVSQAPRAGSRRSLRWIPWAGLGLALFLGGGALAQRMEQRRANDAAAAAAVAPRPPARVVALGRLQPRGGVIDVAAPTTAAAPRVLELLVAEDERVSAGQALFTLDTCPQLAAAEAAAERGVAVAQAALDQTRRDVRTGRKESRAGATAARAAAEQAARDLERQATLRTSGAIPPADLERAKATADQSAAELERARAAATRYDDPADVRLAEANLAAAAADLERARVERETCTVRAPSAGTVLSIDVQPGERAASGTLLRIADLERMEAEVEVFQEAIGQVELGDPVRLASEVLAGEALHGAVRWIGREIGRQTLTSADPAANTDARVVRVRVELDAADIPRAGRFVGLEVIAYIHEESGA